MFSVLRKAILFYPDVLMIDSFSRLKWPHLHAWPHIHISSLNSFLCSRSSSPSAFWICSLRFHYHLKLKISQINSHFSIQTSTLHHGLLTPCLLYATSQDVPSQLSSIFPTFYLCSHLVNSSFYKHSLHFSYVIIFGYISVQYLWTLVLVC